MEVVAGEPNTQVKALAVEGVDVVLEHRVVVFQAVDGVALW